MEQNEQKANTIRQRIKNHTSLMKLIIKLEKRYYYALSAICPNIMSKIAYKSGHGRKLNLKKPQSLTEKLMYAKHHLYWDNPIVAVCADKYKVREYVHKKGCDELLNSLLGAWEDATTIDWSALPQKFAIKCNHGSGYNLLCTDKNKFDTSEAVTTLSQWMKESYGYGKTCEQGIYRKIKRMIIAEEFIETQDGLPPKDYKFFCTYGKCKFLFVASERVNNRTKFDYYWPDWTWIPVMNCHPNAGPQPKPENLEKMIAYAEKLSEDFPIVRVDFYEENGRILFGELTFTHFGCINRFEPDIFDFEFGKCFPEKNGLTLKNNN